MREILFRAKRKDNGEWVYGQYVHNKYPLVDHMEHRIFTGLPDGPFMQHYDVDPDTVGEFTGLLDKNGRKIFEDDIVVDRSYYHSPNHLVEWDYEAAGFIPFIGECGEYIDPKDCEVIGNIIENPKWWEVKA